MILIFYIILSTLSVIFLNFYLVKKNLLINVTGDLHQKFASKHKVPLTGGILIFLTTLYFYNFLPILFFLYFTLVFLLGIFSDLHLIRSAKIRFLIQIIIVISFVYFSEVELDNTKIHILDNLLNNNIFSILFITFCILIVMNGSNFIDGLNTLNVGYYLLILGAIYYLNNLEIIKIFVFPIEYILIILMIIFLLNLFNRIYLGDCGSYLLGFSTSIGLIYIYNLNQNISPFFIVLLLWYPCFETLFSIIRKNIMNKSALFPDSMHLHQHVFFIIKNKFKFKILLSNITSAFLINAYNLLIFAFSVNYVSNSQVQILLIFLNVLLYSFIYFKTFVIRYKKI